jgi:membrane-bound metal-dependent hydrolase YbcI (DUF457 family)
MLGHSHALSGLVTGAAASELALHLPLPGTLALAGLTAAWATVPDLDTTGSCAARSLGFLSEGFAAVVHFLARGHRHGTHSVLGVAVLTAITWLACIFRDTLPGRATLGLLLAIAIAAGLRALHFAGHSGDLLAIAAAAVIAWLGYGLSLVPLACALGCATHIAGDMLTESGCPLGWPASEYRFRLLPHPLSFVTGTWRELWVVDPALTATVVLLAWHALTTVT